MSHYFKHCTKCDKLLTGNTRRTTPCCESCGQCEECGCGCLHFAVHLGTVGECRCIPIAEGRGT